MIPGFGSGSVLPPFVGGGPADFDGRSPYIAPISELVERFATSPERTEILRGLLSYRNALAGLGLLRGFQWIAGSFVEDCETGRGRAPNDVDIVTFVHRPNGFDDDDQWTAFLDANPNAFDHGTVKRDYKCDTYFEELEGGEPDDLIMSAIYWYGLFSHQRDSARWKGMIQVELDSDDDAAQLFLTRGAWA